MKFKKINDVTFEVTTQVDSVSVVSLPGLYKQIELMDGRIKDLHEKLDVLIEKRAELVEKATEFSKKTKVAKKDGKAKTTRAC